MAEQIVWQGDLEDDCFARWGGMTAHAECMDVPTSKGVGGREWFCSVTLYGGAAGREELFHSAEDGVLPLTGAAARGLCELVMRAHAAGVSWR